MAIISSLLAKIATFCMILSIGIWLLRVLIEKGSIKKNGKLEGFYNKLVDRHTLIGKILVLSALAHGIMSSDKLLSLNLGTICWVLSILLGVSAAFKKDDNEEVWFKAHRALSIITFIVMVVHIVTVSIR